MRFQSPLVYYLDNENKKLPDCVQAIMVEN